MTGGNSTVPLLMTVEETADALRIGRSKVFDLIRCGDLYSIKIGRLRRVAADEVHAFLLRLLNERESV